ncbi:2-oxoglutarate dehydrogenase E1 component [Desulfococcus multivorans]|uniref:oxoglutarate dehydrogenase (succinyl-transferring) n=1 Tax=Desulfococcus multivorans DSM 2059 TaxID=1121405 RepID=S7U691_DESML|nr:2-oxoglutarate dehydrogenase E1 component [Desulfococcus multivorans]AQV02982.2 2-oxoglutarate dehydrogenase subunit E1 [Desulfococcus multivorans]EPR44847.1 2-oxoglutarate dehydrogenase, E1 subunit [Desulfococcus multivorans DSM 2059]SJZ52133.1 2-oxoglutarate dehydrogenase E1 component [Desulfococcus multivorans DSM 2059]
MIDISETMNMAYIDRQYQLWKNDPDAVERDWRIFFKGFETAGGLDLKTVVRADEGLSRPDTDLPEEACTIDKTLLQSRVEALKYRYRDMGHLLACLDPLVACPTDHPLLNISAVGLSPEDLDTAFYTRRFSKTLTAPLKDIIRELRETYCRSVGVEYMHLQDPEERRWLQDRMEPIRNQPVFSAEDKRRIITKLYQSAFFESFLHKKYTGQTRFSLEGADALIAAMDALFLHASEQGVTEIILGMAHRGRLNVLTNILGKHYEEIFREFINSYDPESLMGAGDVKYHNGFLADLTLANQRKVRAFLVNNPSHLESVDPVVEGIAYARQDALTPAPRNQVLPLLIHGDSAFAGQGVVAETLNLSQLEGYRTEGTVHIIINNQIGYTTLPENARSTRYSTDIAKMLMVPIFHVHGENPEAVIHVIKLAFDYRMAFGKDVIVDMVCYRRFGHNEGDEPYFTQPAMYERIRERPPLYKIYGEKMVDDGEIDDSGLAEIENGLVTCLEEGFSAAQDNPRIFPVPRFYENWSDYHGDYSFAPVDTAVSQKSLKALAAAVNTPPSGFAVHPKLERLLGKRLESVESGRDIDWANAESLAFASLLSEGHHVRLSGQDSARGTFSQRHSILVDVKTGEFHVPLTGVCRKKAVFSVFNSALSEAGVLGFEYGYSMIRPAGLTLWEAQFGDFVNNAQGIVDLYIVSGETKWQRRSGLVMLLPHGWEGLGPEHSSARMERFLQLCAHDNIQVCNPTTPAQYFHLLRRQAKSSWRKPLVLMTPKSLLRHPRAVSRIDDFSRGTFQEVIDDDAAVEKARRVIFCSGKIYYQLLERRETLKAYDIAIVRVEQFYPFPREKLERIVGKYRKADQWCWVQEGPVNMEGWSFMAPRLKEIVGTDPTYIGRPASASPATGFANIYKQEQSLLPDKAVGQLSGVQTG